MLARPLFNVIKIKVTGTVGVGSALRAGSSLLHCVAVRSFLQFARSFPRNRRRRRRRRRRWNLSSDISHDDGK